MNKEEIYLVYDRQCPACRHYCELVRIRESVGTLRLIDAREPSPVMQTITEAGLDIDQGMVLKVHEQLYYGADAINALALLGTRAGWFNRLNFWVFRSRTLSCVLYPVLRTCRNVLLRLRGTSKINNLGYDGNDRF